MDLSDNDKITGVGIMELLKNNPSLETLKTSEIDDIPSEEELCTLFPRLKAHNVRRNFDLQFEKIRLFCLCLVFFIPNHFYFF